MDALSAHIEVIYLLIGGGLLSGDLLLERVVGDVPLGRWLTVFWDDFNHVIQHTPF
jgi:hypothetical protein